MAQTPQQYYGSPSSWGSGQYVTLQDVVNNFMLMYVGYDKLIDNADRYNVLFHAKRAVQELNYDAFKELKVLETIVNDDLKVILPQDYVNYVRISYEIDGVLFKLTENQTVNWATRYDQDSSYDYIFDVNGNLITEQSELDKIRIDGTFAQYPFPGIWYGRDAYMLDGDWYFLSSFGGLYGADASKLNGNPTYVINKAEGVINFSSGLQGRLIVLEYISDGLESEDPSQITVHKFAEEFIYSYIKWCLLNNRVNVQEYIVRRARDEKSALLRNAKIRLSNINPRRLLMALRGKDNWIK
jgi:hypothetical protein